MSGLATEADRLAYAVTGDQATADTAVEETFMELWQDAATLDVSRAGPAGWLAPRLPRRAPAARPARA